jgi:hypothetical protein
LPAFQRDWKWNRRQVVELFDSLRNQYPIGSFLLAKPGEELDLSPRSFKFASSSADTEATAQVVLDGQQRITAGIQLFFATSTEQGTHYFLDIEKLEKLFQEYATNKGETVSTLLDKDHEIKSFIKDLDTDSGYIKSMNRVSDPYARLKSHHQLFTPLLLAERDRDLETYLDSYFEQFPSKKPFFRNVIKPNFQVSNSPLIPYIVIEDTDVTGLSRIFTTLNTSGKLLTPFELVVAILFPQNVRLQEDIEESKQLYPTYYPNMDRTGEIALQTCVLLEKGDPKKSLLPKTLTKAIWVKNRVKAFQSLDKVGKFLSEHLGMPLAKSSAYTPYDSVFCPLASAWSEINVEVLEQSAKKRAIDRLSKYVVGASLSNRYQEGVHNKQKADAAALVDWISSDDDERMPAWLKEVKIPSLKRVAPSGAIGKTILCLLNRRNLRDPITSELVPLGGSEGEDHHIFPTRFVPNLPGWDARTMSANWVLNIMRTTKGTNATYLNSNPREQIMKAQDANQANLSSCLADQAISNDCVQILLKPEKTYTDFFKFIELREIEVQTLISNEFQFAKSNSEPEPFANYAFELWKHRRSRCPFRKLTHVWMAYSSFNRS